MARDFELLNHLMEEHRQELFFAHLLRKMRSEGPLPIRTVAEEGKLVLKFTGFEAAKDNTLTIQSVGDYNIGTVSVKLVKK